MLCAGVEMGSIQALCRGIAEAQAAPWVPPMNAIDPSTAGPVPRWLVSLFDRSAVAMAVLSAEGFFMRANAALCRLLDRAAPDVEGHRWREFAYLGDMPLDFVEPVHLDPTAPESRLDRRFVRADGSVVWAQVALFHSPDAHDPRGVWVAQVVDITEHVEARLEHETTQRRFRLAMSSAPTGMAVLDLDRRFVEVNPALCRMVGRDEQWLLHHRLPDILDSEDDTPDLHDRAEVLSGRSSSVAATRHLIAADGRRLVVQHAVAAVRDEEGLPASFVSQFVDVSALHRAQDRLQFLLTREPDLALPDRERLAQHMARVLSHPPREGTQLAVVFVELPDAEGQVADDAAAVIAAAVRKDDIVSRVGTSEFVVALPGMRSPDDALGVAHKLRATVVTAPLGPDEVVGTRMLAGIALANYGDDTSDVIQRADHALERAREDPHSWLAVEVR